MYYCIFIIHFMWWGWPETHAPNSQTFCNAGFVLVKGQKLLLLDNTQKRVFVLLENKMILQLKEHLSSCPAQINPTHLRPRDVHHKHLLLLSNDWWHITILRILMSTYTHKLTNILYSITVIPYTIHTNSHNKLTHPLPSIITNI